MLLRCYVVLIADSRMRLASCQSTELARSAGIGGAVVIFPDRFGRRCLPSGRAGPSHGLVFDEPRNCYWFDRGQIMFAKLRVVDH